MEQRTLNSVNLGSNRCPPATHLPDMTPYFQFPRSTVRIHVAGSAYTYAYATMGEFVAWVIGWDLILEYALARQLSRWLCHIIGNLMREISRR